MFPRELYRGDYYRVVHSLEEQQEALASGWSDAKPQDHKYLPVSASWVVAAPPPAPAPTVVATEPSSDAKSAKPGKSAKE